MRQPKRHFVERAGTAVYLDATIGILKPCRSGCVRDTGHLCIHRFGRQMYVVAQQERIAFTRLTDLQVVLDFLHVILHRWKDGTKGVWNRRFVILTNDKRFLQSAESAYRRGRNMRNLPLKFVVGGVIYEMRGYPWTIKIEVHTVPVVPTSPPDNRRDAILYAVSELS